MGLTISKMFYGICAFTFVWICFAQVYGDFTTRYSIQHDANNTFAKGFNQGNSTFNMAASANSELYNSETTKASAFDNMLNGGFSMIRILFDSFNMIKEIIYSIAHLYGVPNELVTLALTITLFAIVVAAAAAVFRTGGV